MRLVDDEPDIPPQVNVVPMIDAIFAILAFFILSTLTLTRSEGLPVNLPEAATSQPQESSEATLTIDANAQLFLNQKPLTLDQIIPQVQALKGSSTTFLVIIQADETVQHGRVIAVMDRVRQIEGVRLAIATTEP
jgi:biopolymer transport protein ExbD